MSQSERGTVRAALLTSTSGGPSRSSVAAISASIASASPTSTTAALARRRPPRWRLDATGRGLVDVRDDDVVAARASSRAIASPMPRPAPVTRRPGGSQLAPDPLAVVDRLGGAARRAGVADDVHLDPGLAQRHGQIVARGAAQRQHDGVDPLDRSRPAGPPLDELEPVAGDALDA